MKVTEGQRPILPSAHRHNIDEDDMLHAIRNAIDAYEEDNDVTMFIGPRFDGALIEVGVAHTTEGPVIIHAMKARRKYLR
jgi:hypothetical protein